MTGALFLGRVFARFHLPKVTGYLLAGLLFGPSLSELLGITPVIDRGTLHSLEFISRLGICLIMFSVGAHFSFQSLRQYGGKIIVVSLLEALITLLLVTLGVYGLGFSFVGALFLGIMALNTAPGATQMVIREYSSEGKLSDLMLVLIGLNNFLGIVFFVILFHFTISSEPPISLLLNLGGPIAAGFGAGVIVAFWEQRLSGIVERQVALLGIVILMIAATTYFGLNLLYASLVMGVTVINVSPHKKRLFNEIHSIDYPVYMLFFAIAGTHLQLSALPAMGVIGVGFILLRIVGKISGAFLGAKAAGCSPVIQNHLGIGMLCQAGIAIGLSSVLAQAAPNAGGLEIQNIVLAGVVVFEAIGPILTRIALMRAGEVTLIAILTGRAPVGILEGMHDLVNQFGTSLGISLSKNLKNPSEVPIKMVMRRHVDTIPEDLGFDQLLKTMGHSRYDRLPVVNDKKHLIGVIHYADIADVLFVEELRGLVVARDIAVPTLARLTENDTLEHALDVFRKYPHVSYLFVYSSKDGKSLAGVLRHNDVLSSHGSV
ncbi:cation:proton antiporter [Myxococcota bacterium]|nr:cation:proton antiporter [Myxococcota bacterium]